MAELSGTTLTRLTVLNTGLLAVNTLLLVGLLLREPAPAPAAASAVPSAVPVGGVSEAPRPMSGGAPSQAGVAGFIDSTVTPLAAAAADHGVSAGDVLPTDAEIAAAVASDSLDSAETRAVIDKLKAGYATFNMPFPEVKIPGPSGGGGGAVAPTGGQGGAIEEWAVPTVDRLRAALAEKGESEAGLVPTEEEVAAAVASGRFESEETRWIIDMLKNGYARMGLDFPEPGGSVGASSPTSSADPGEQEVLRAYFEANVQRLKLMAGKQGVEVADVLPDAAVIDAAVASGDISSEAARPALDQLKAGYERVGLEFREPVVSP